MKAGAATAIFVAALTYMAVWYTYQATIEQLEIADLQSTQYEVKR